MCFQTFILYPYLEDEPLDAGKALSTLALFNVLRLPTILFTAFINSFINANVSAKRVIPYLLAEDAEGFNTGDKHKTHTIGTDTMEDKVNMIYVEHLMLKTKFCNITVPNLQRVANFHIVEKTSS